MLSKVFQWFCKCFRSSEKSENAPEIMALHPAYDKIAQELEQTKQKLNQIETQFDAFSHETRNLVYGIQGGVSLQKNAFSQLEKDTKISKESLEAAKSGLDIINACAEQLTSVVNNRLLLSQLEHHKVILNTTPFKLKHLLDKLHKIFHWQAKQKSIKLTIDLPDTLNTWFKADEFRLSIILTNLISNALKFTDKGSITVTVALDQQPNSDPKLCFSVKDTGGGMTPEEKDSLFNRFVQANSNIAPKHGGNGLGLSICKELVTIMGGEIKVESTKGVETEFTFWIRTNLLVQKEQDEIDKANKNHIHRRKNSILAEFAEKSISALVVEDNLINRKLLCNTLKEYCSELQTANNGKEAIEAVQAKKKSGSKLYDVIIMDLNMPGMGGLEATETIRALGYKIPIIGLSGNDDEELLEQATKAGMNDYLTKGTPAQANQLIAKIAKLTLSKPKISIEQGFLPNQVPNNQEECSIIISEISDTSPNSPDTPNENSQNNLHFKYRSASRVISPLQIQALPSSHRVGFNRNMSPTQDV